MAISSIHIEAGHGGYFAHNSRETHTVNSVFTDEPNFCSCSKEEAFETYRSELEIRTEAYTDRTGQKLQKNAITHLSAIVNFNKEHTPEDMQKVCDLLESRFDTKVIQFSMHRDEGKSIDDKNYHAHIEFMGLDSKGESVRRKLDRPTLRELQSDVAKLLGMERGHDYAKEGLPRPKRLDTYEWKAHKKGVEKEVEAVQATQKDLKDEIALLRSQLKEQEATRSDYAELEKINKELKEQIKAKDLTISELKTALEATKASKDVSIHSEEKKTLIEPLNASKSLIMQFEKESDVELTDWYATNDVAQDKRTNDLKAIRTITVEQIIESSKSKGFMSDKIDEPTLKANLTRVLNEHNRIHDQSSKMIETFTKIKDNTIKAVKKLTDGLMNKAQELNPTDRIKAFLKDHGKETKKGMER